jgi:hypothetical protein
LRFIGELTEGGGLRIFPIASSSDDEQRILNALRFIREDSER